MEIIKEGRVNKYVFPSGFFVRQMLVLCTKLMKPNHVLLLYNKCLLYALKLYSFKYFFNPILKTTNLC